MKIELTAAEVSHLLTLMDENQRHGWYFGGKEKYWKTSKSIQRKLEKAVKA